MVASHRMPRSRPRLYAPALIVALFVWYVSGVEAWRLGKWGEIGERPSVLLTRPFQALRAYVSREGDDHLYYEYAELMVGGSADLEWIARKSPGDEPATALARLKVSVRDEPGWRLPYRDFPVEYPPLPLALMLLPRLGSRLAGLLPGGPRSRARRAVPGDLLGRRAALGRHGDAREPRSGVVADGLAGSGDRSVAVLPLRSAPGRAGGVRALRLRRSPRCGGGHPVRAGGDDQALSPSCSSSPCSRSSGAAASDGARWCWEEAEPWRRWPWRPRSSSRRPSRSSERSACTASARSTSNLSSARSCWRCRGRRRSCGPTARAT